MDFNVRVEYEPRQIRHIAVECPKCKKLFTGWDVTDHDLKTEIDLYFAEFACPVCGFEFGNYISKDHLYDKRNGKPIIAELPYEEIYKGCLHRKGVWE